MNTNNDFNPIPGASRNKSRQRVLEEVKALNSTFRKSKLFKELFKMQNPLQDPIPEKTLLNVAFILRCLRRKQNKNAKAKLINALQTTFQLNFDRSLISRIAGFKRSWMTTFKIENPERRADKRAELREKASRIFLPLGIALKKPSQGLRRRLRKYDTKN